MKINSIIQFSIIFILFPFIGSNTLFGIEKAQLPNMTKLVDVDTFKSLLRKLSNESENELFALHFQSMIDVIEATTSLSSTEIGFIEATVPVFSDPHIDGSAADISSYLERERPLTIAWVSPTDGAVSFFRLKLPKDWDEKKAYPLYVDLHGLTSIANNPIEYLTNYYRVAPSTTYAFEDGYQISPWGRGNLWYQGISETDIWEGIDVIENLVKIDRCRKYLVGHSMGGYGAWSIASKSPEVWAAIGIQAGALWYGTDDMLSIDKIQSLVEVPTYFVVGTSDGLYDINLQAYNLLKGAGNENTEFVSFNGGHEKLPLNVEAMYNWLVEFENDSFTAIPDYYFDNKKSLIFIPNLVHGETTIQLNLDKPGRVHLEVFNNNGKKVATIIDKYLLEGESSIRWDRGNLKPGIYSYLMVSNRTNISGKLVLF